MNLRRGRHRRPVRPFRLSGFVFLAAVALSPVVVQAGFDPGSATEPADPPPRPAQGLEVLAPALPRTPSPPAATPLPPPDPVDEAWRIYAHTVDLRFAVSTPRPDAFPPLPAGSGEGRRIVYANSAQRVWLVDDLNRVVDSYLVSGRRGVPRPGTYRVYSKSELAWAGHDGITMKHMVRFARGRSLPIGFHSIPVTASGRPIQTEEDLGSFRSAGCVRQAPDKALQLYLFADLGTPVVVLP